MDHYVTVSAECSHRGHHFGQVYKFIITVNFQNNAQVQINAWFKLTPGTKHTVYNLLHCFLYFKRTPGSI